jgi:hypothetical protein
MRTLILALIVAALACGSARAADDPMTSAYAAIAAGDNAAARPLIEQHLALHPDDVQAWHQLAYVDEALKDYPAALAALDQYLKYAGSDDRAKLQRAYDLANAGKQADATAQFAALRSSYDAAVAKQATAEFNVRSAKPLRDEGWSVFGYAVNESRFSDTFYGVDARKSFSPKAAVEPYAVLHLVGDTRSGSGQNAQIFSDNAAVTDVGVRTRIAKGTFLFAEGGLGFGLRNQGTITDARYGIASSRQWGGDANGVSFDGSLATYSRYQGNTIGYLDVRKAIPLAGPIALLIGADAGLDAQRLYYNNFLQGDIGLQFTKGALKLRLETYEGVYLGRGLARPTKTTYTSIRPVILFGFSR